VKSPTYWDAVHVALERAVALTSDDQHAILRQFQAGMLDYTGHNVSLPSEYMDRLRTRTDFRTADYLGVYYYWFNVLAPPVNDVRVRRALTLSLDREAIVRYVTRAGQKPADHFVPDAMLTPITGYRSPEGPRRDVEAARRLLAEAGYPGGRGFPTLTVLYNTLEGHRQIAEAIQQMWKRELGIAVEIENQEWKVFLQTTQDGHFQVARGGWIGDYNDPYTFLSLLLSDSEQNDTAWKNLRYDEFVLAALRSVERDERNRLYAAAEALINEELPVLPLYFYTKSWLEQPWVRGLHPNTRDEHPLRDISIAEVP
jgi:ABC-type oligopeptide transport system substrate-binding subunit